MRFKLMTIVLAISILTISPYNSFAQTDLGAYLNKKNACTYINLNSLKSTLAINHKISTFAQFSDSLFNGFVGAECELSWDDNNDENQIIIFNLTQLNPKNIFPPKKLSEKQLLAKINQANNAMEPYIDQYDKNTIETMRKNNENTIRNANNFELINDLGETAVLTIVLTNGVNLFELKVLSKKIVLKINLSSEAVTDDPKEKIIKIATLILKGN